MNPKVQKLARNEYPFYYDVRNNRFRKAPWHHNLFSNYPWYHRLVGGQWKYIQIDSSYASWQRIQQWTYEAKPKNRKPVEVHLPEGGWEERTWYLVDVSYRGGNPVHRSLYYTGFLNGPDKSPGGYNGFVPLNGPDFEDPPATINQVRYIKVIRKLISEPEGQK